jgi:hypothetical protein
MARLASALCAGGMGVDGVRLLSEDAVQKMMEAPVERVNYGFGGITDNFTRGGVNVFGYKPAARLFLHQNSSTIHFSVSDQLTPTSDTDSTVNELDSSAGSDLADPCFSGIRSFRLASHTPPP